jgi:hypothetical protein
MNLLKIGYRIQQQTVLAGESSSLPPLYIFSETLDTNVYNDITSVSSWMNYGRINYDYTFCRVQGRLFVEQEGWSGLTQEDKFSAASNFIVDKTYRDEVLTEEQQKSFWDILVDSSYNSRLNRWKSAKSYMSYYLTLTESADIAVSTKTLSEDFVTYNIQSLTTDGVNGLFDWITSTNNYSSGNGFNGKPYWSQTHQDNLMKILKDGIY